MLSPFMQKYLESVTALHSADLLPSTHSFGRIPVTGWKTLFFSPGFVTKIVGVPKTENNAVIALLNDVVATSPEV
jgi:sulfonate dioxygenase